MADTGWVVASSIAGTRGTGPSWSFSFNGEFASTRWNVGAYQAANGGTSRYLDFIAPDFSSIPIGATIDGLEFKISLTTSPYPAVYNEVILYYNGQNIGNNQAGGLSVNNGTRIFGGSANTWGTDLTRGIVTDSSFRVGVRVNGTDEEYTSYVGLYTPHEFKITYTEAVLPTVHKNRVILGVG